MSPQDPVVLTIPPRRWGPREQFALEGDVLVRLTGRRQTRWPLARLRRFTLGVRRSPYAKPLRFVRLRFAGQNQTIVCGPEATDYAIFVCALARAAAHAAPDVRFQAEGGRLAGLLVMSAALLGAGAVAMALAAVMAGLAPLGLDLGRPPELPADLGVRRNALDQPGGAGGARSAGPASCASERNLTAFSDLNGWL